MPLHASEILCEMQVVKVSNITGKVTEGSNYFTESPGLALLVPILKSRARDALESMSDASPSSVGVTGGGGGVSSATFGSSVEDQNKSRAVPAISVKSNFNRRLITLDSTDPEFDEDSDPDADLDI